MDARVLGGDLRHPRWVVQEGEHRRGQQFGPAAPLEELRGQFAPGDIADLDSGVEHQPVTVPGTACICVSALDAPLRFPGWLAQRLQPLFKL